MTIERIQVGPRMSQAVIHNKTVYLAGQVASGAAGKTLTEQTRDILATIDALLVEEGTLYPALWRLESKRLVEAEWGLSENNRKAKFYKLTARGRKELNAAAGRWRRMTHAIGLILGEANE